MNKNLNTNGTFDNSRININEVAENDYKLRVMKYANEDLKPSPRQEEHPTLVTDTFFRPTMKNK